MKKKKRAARARAPAKRAKKKKAPAQRRPCGAATTTTTTTTTRRIIRSNPRHRGQLEAVVVKGSRRRATFVQVRVNPTPLQFGAPRWQMLRKRGDLNKSVREQTRGHAGAYMIREAGKSPVLYIGETHTPVGSEKQSKRGPAKAQRLRWWKTIVRHLYPWEWNYDAHDPRYKDPDKRPDEWVYRGNHDLEIALYPSPPREVKTLEGQLVLEYRPIHNRKAFVPVDELEEAPF